MSVGHVGVFCQNLGIIAYTLENYSNFKNKFVFNYGSILSSQDFAGMDQFRLRERLRKIREMCCVKMNKTKKVREMTVV